MVQSRAKSNVRGDTSDSKTRSGSETMTGRRSPVLWYGGMCFDFLRRLKCRPCRRKNQVSPVLRQKAFTSIVDVEKAEWEQCELLLDDNEVEPYSKIHKLESYNRRLEDQLTQKTEQIETLETHIDQEFRRIDSVVADREGKIWQLKQELEEQRRLTGAVKDKDAQIQRLEHKLEERDMLIHKLERDVQTCKADKEVALTSYSSAVHTSEIDGRIWMIENELAENIKLIHKLESDLQACVAEKEDAMTRLSEVVALQVRDNNPDIVDLSDAFRPEKLADLSNNIYDNEWMDALEELPENWTEQEQVALLLDIVMRCFDFCNKTGKQQMEYVSKWMIPEADQDKKLTTQKMLKDARRQKALEILPVVEKECFTKLKQDITAFSTGSMSITDSLHAYIKTCVKLGWMMAVQDPPCVLVCPGWRLSSDGNQSKLSFMNMLELRPDEMENGTELLTRVGNTAIICGTENADCTPRCTKGDISTEGVMFDKNVLKEYTHFGKYIAYVVWPFMLLHEGGQILTKGVAQGCD